MFHKGSRKHHTSAFHKFKFLIPRIFKNRRPTSYQFPCYRKNVNIINMIYLCIFSDLRIVLIGFLIISINNNVNCMTAAAVTIDRLELQQINNTSNYRIGNFFFSNNKH